MEKKKNELEISDFTREPIKKLRAWINEQIDNGMTYIEVDTEAERNIVTSVKLIATKICNRCHWNTAEEGIELCDNCSEITSLETNMSTNRL